MGRSRRGSPTVASAHKTNNHEFLARPITLIWPPGHVLKDKCGDRKVPNHVYASHLRV